MTQSRLLAALATAYFVVAARDVVGAVVLAALSVGWYASEHVIVVVLGAVVTWALVR